MSMVVNTKESPTPTPTHIHLHPHPHPHPRTCTYTQHTSSLHMSDVVNTTYWGSKSTELVQNLMVIFATVRYVGYGLN